MIQKRNADLRSKMIHDTEHDLSDLMHVEGFPKSASRRSQRRALLDLFGSLTRRLSFRANLAARRRRSGR